MDERDNIIVLNDEDGVSTEFEFLDLVELDGAEYVVLFPVEDARTILAKSLSSRLNRQRTPTKKAMSALKIRTCLTQYLRSSRRNSRTNSTSQRSKGERITGSAASETEEQKRCALLAQRASQRVMHLASHHHQVGSGSHPPQKHEKPRQIALPRLFNFVFMCEKSESSLLQVLLQSGGCKKEEP